MGSHVVCHRSALDSPSFAFWIRPSGRGLGTCTRTSHHQSLPEQPAGVLTETQGTELPHEPRLGLLGLHLTLVYGSHLSFLASILSVHSGLLQVLNLLYVFLVSQSLSLHTLS